MNSLNKNMFVPTHINRNNTLFQEGIEYCKNAGKIDLTAGETEGIPVPDAIEKLINENIDMKNITISSDANGSTPKGGVGRVQALYDDIVSCIFQKNVPMETAFKLVTENVAKTLKLYPKKGILQEGSDADILITDKQLRVNKIISMGKILVEY